MKKQLAESGMPDKDNLLKIGLPSKRGTLPKINFCHCFSLENMTNINAFVYVVMSSKKH